MMLQNCFSQLLNNKPVEISVGPIRFNAEVIKQKKVKSIVLDIVDKPDGSIIIDKGATQGYEFDAMGKLSRYYYTILNKTQAVEIDVPALKKRGRVIRQATTRTVTKYINDTIFVNVFYDNESRIISKRVRTGDFYDAWYYEYNDLDQLKKEMHCKETNVSENKNEFKMGVQKILSTETFSYVSLTPTQVKKSCLNDEGREYKKAIINYDEKGNKLSENYEFIVSWMVHETSYTYSNANRVTGRTIRSNESGEKKLRSVFAYDDKGVLLTEQKFNKEVLTNEISFLYEPTNTLITSHINRDHKNASIGIVKYLYTFY